MSFFLLILELVNPVITFYRAAVIVRNKVTSLLNLSGSDYYVWLSVCLSFFLSFLLSFMTQSQVGNFFHEMYHYFIWLFKCITVLKFLPPSPNTVFSDSKYRSRYLNNTVPYRAVCGSVCQSVLPAHLMLLAAHCMLLACTPYASC